MSGVLDGLSAEDSAKAFDAIRKIKTGTGKERTDALETIFNLGKEDKAKLSLCQVSTGLPDALLQTLRLTNDSYATSWAVSCIGRLSASVRQNKEYLASPASGMVPELVRLLAQSNCKDNCYVFFGNCILSPVTVSYLLSESLGLIDAAKHDIQTNPDYKFPYTLLANAVTIMDNSHCAYFARMRIHEMIVNRIVQAGPDPTKWPDRNTGCVYRSMGFVTSFSTLPDGRKAIRELQKKDFFLEFLKTKEKERMQASIIMANLYGRDEGDTTTKSLLQTYPDLLQLLVNLLAAILNYNSDSKEVKDYKAMGLAFGVTKMRDASSTLRCLSISDGNKAVMLRHPSLLNFVMQGIQLFINNSDECAAVYQGFQSYAGGGGKDFESIENFLELLLQLSFYYEDDTRLQREFNIPSYQMVTRVKAILDLPADRKLPFQARQFALQLLKRLDPQSMPAPKDEVKATKIIQSPSLPVVAGGGGGGGGNSGPGQHIMLSYAWGANKAYVAELGKKLRQMGYDVWRDEDGSSLVPPMSGDIVETMAEAIQHSYMVVICVSRQYKDSTNCRAEAKYARARQQSHDLKICYVMMDQKYTTVSAPTVVDGWLGFMVGTELWYPMWDGSQVDTAAQSIAGQARNNAKLGGGGGGGGGVSNNYNTSNQKSESANSPPPKAGGIDYNVAWECVKDPNKAKDAEQLKSLLDELGLSAPDELQLLEKSQLEEIASLLKAIPQKKFAGAVGL
mmetsp:Transcript_11283/g.12169  ORF Transcript_11283/g.12169 Transcript_11283/m.12169 type:complete len:734 (+) Transcript_11283:56-2257(+)